jgi:hypothetical protein
VLVSLRETAADLRLFQSGKPADSVRKALDQWTATRKRYGEFQDQWTSAQYNDRRLSGWLSTVQPNGLNRSGWLSTDLGIRPPIWLTVHRSGPDRPDRRRTKTAATRSS